MTDYKLVPVDTLKSIHRDLDACQKVIWMHGGFDPAYWRDAQARLKEIDELLAAPAVQGEPVGYVRPHQLEALRSGKACGITLEDKPDAHNRVTIPLYAAPQPAEQPAPISRNLRSVLSMILNALDRDAAEGRPARGEMASELRSAIADEQSTRRKPPMAYPNGLDMESMPAMVEPVDEQNQGCDSQTDNFDTQPSLTAESERQASDVAGLVEALELAQGFLRNKGYSEEDPLLLGAINAALAAHRKGGE